MEIQIVEIEPIELEFGGVLNSTDPKVGLRQAGPFDARFGAAQLKEVRAGLIGDNAMLIKASAWIERCQSKIESTMKNTHQYPDFLGFEAIFNAKLITSPQWTHTIDENELQAALALSDDYLRFESVLDLYSKGLQRLSTSEITRPNVIFCCLSESVLSTCHYVEKKLTKQQKADLKKMANGTRFGTQLSLFDEQMEDTEEDLLFRNFRRALKAQAILSNIPIQIGRDRLFLDLPDNQDGATRAWNSSVAIYYKAGGIPWRLKSGGIETCFVGITFHHLKTTQKTLVKSCLAQGFSSVGEGFALRGADVPYDPSISRDVHLIDSQAYQLGRQIVDEYVFRTGVNPQRVVLHKTSFFSEQEENGFRRAFDNIPIVELINLLPTSFRMLKHGKYPINRGTLCIVNEAKYYLFNTGFIKALGTYPGPHVPCPIEIRSNEPIDPVRAAEDILGLARMNWNTSSISNGKPVTLFFSRQVGGIMAELGILEPTVLPNPIPTSFRFYI